MRANQTGRAANEGGLISNLINLMPEPMWICENETERCLAVNEAAVARYGYSRRQFLSMTMRELRLQEDFSGPGEAAGGTEDAAAKQSTRRRHVLADGSVIDVDIAEKDVTFNGRAALLIRAHNITDRAKIIERLEEQKSLFDVAEHLGRLGIWSFDISENRLSWSDGARRIFGVDKSASLSLDYFLSLVHPDDRERLRAAQAAADARGGNFECEYRVRAASGEERIVFERGGIVMNEAKRAVRRLGVVTDITERRRSEDMLKRSADVLKIAGEIARFGGWRVDLAANSMIWSDEVCAIHELPPGFAATVEEGLNYYAPGDRSRIQQAFRDCAKTGNPFDFELRIVTAKGNLRWVRSVGVPVRDGGGRIVAVDGAFQDITEQRAAEGQLRLLEAAAAKINDIIIITDAEPIDGDGPKIVYVNDAFVRRTGYAREEAIGKTPRILQGPKTDRNELDRIRKALEQWRPIRSELVNYAKNGQEFWLELDVVPIADAAGRFTHWVAVQRDQTETRRAKQELIESEARFRAAARATADAIWDWDIDAGLVWWSEGYTKNFGFENASVSAPKVAFALRDALSLLPEEGLKARHEGRRDRAPQDEGDFWSRHSEIAPLNSWSDHIHPDDYDRVVSGVKRAIERKDPYWEAEYRYRHCDGRIMNVLDRGSLILDERGAPKRFVGGMNDITALTRSAQRAAHHIALLRAITKAQSEDDDALNREIIESAQLLVDADGAVIATVQNDELVYTSACGMASPKLGARLKIGSSLSGDSLQTGETILCVDSETDDRVDIRAAREIGFRSMIVALLPGDARPFGVLKVMSKRPHAFNEDDAGAIALFAQSVGALLERRDIERRLRQSQRLEAIGKLTGGVAHDFNNLLTIIIGNADTIREAVEHDERLRPLAEMTRRAAERGAELTRRLLAFARQQPLAPKPVDVNALIHSMDAILRRAVGECVEIKVNAGAALRPALVDPAQLENAILNLAINARDAMPDGGVLTIATANVELAAGDFDSAEDIQPGRYVVVSVTDSGIGMRPDVRVRALEPFFTTKEAGKGNGLGLSTVHGFAKQSRGHLRLASEPGAGTSVAIYVPQASETSVQPASNIAQTPEGGAEKILLVEDDDLVRVHVLGQLRTLGYKVVEARNSREALDALRRIDDFDLIFTDIVMPGGMSGEELAKEIRKIRPGSRILFTSGYAESANQRRGRLQDRVNFIGKPFRQAELDLKIREVLRTC